MERALTCAARTGGLAVRLTARARSWFRIFGKRREGQGESDDEQPAHGGETHEPVIWIQLVDRKFETREIFKGDAGLAHHGVARSG